VLTITPSLDNPDGFWSKFRIQVSMTGYFQGEEKTIVTETNWSQRQGPIRIYNIEPVVGRFIRIIGDEDKAGVRLVQFRAYGLSN